MSIWDIRVKDNLHVYSSTTRTWSVCRSWDRWFYRQSDTWEYRTATNWTGAPCGDNRYYACSCGGQIWYSGAWRHGTDIFVWSGTELWR